MSQTPWYDDCSRFTKSSTLIAYLMITLLSEDIVAVGHRIVHGGTVFPESCVIDSEILEKLAPLNSLAPLHNPHNLAGILAATRIFPTALQVS